MAKENKKVEEMNTITGVPEKKETKLESPINIMETKPEPVPEPVKAPKVVVPMNLQYSYVFSVEGKNGMQILPDRIDISPNHRMMLSLEELVQVCQRGFSVRWINFAYNQDNWTNVLIKDYNVNGFIAFINDEVKNHRLAEIDFNY